MYCIDFDDGKGCSRNNYRGGGAFIFLQRGPQNYRSHPPCIHLCIKVRASPPPPPHTDISGIALKSNTSNEGYIVVALV